ncbi:MAG: class I mannose-6-phosphate isomerase [Duncaniella sp.]|nr:class I mannose-6-phosphate isomerase [Duncaniella sp.]
MKLVKFEPIFKSTLWGGRRIASLKGVEADDKHIGESWEISAVDGSISVVSDGPERGMTLTALIDKYKDQLVGHAVFDRYGNRFPLLVKFIDASLDLSIQVHPDDDLAEQRHGTRGKTEMWYVVDAAPGASLLLGFKDSMTKEQYIDSVARHTIADHICRYEVKKGDCFFIPAGRIHSIGAGIFLAEIQDMSDITYRIYDFNRRDDNGNLRQLHTDLAVDAIDYSVSDSYRTDYEAEDDKVAELVSCQHFSTSVLTLTKPVTLDLSARDSFTIVMVCEGEALINADGEERHVSGGETLLVAASVTSVALTPSGDKKAVLLMSHL